MSEPEKRFKCGGCEAAIFKNEINKNGNVIKIKKAVIQKRYKSIGGEWNRASRKAINSLCSKKPSRMLSSFSIGI